MPMLELKDVHIYYGNIHAIKDVSFQIYEGDIVALLGANGAGKSTILKAISRLIKPSQGDIKYNGKSLLTKNASRVVRDGIIHCLEDRGIFPDFTVAENLEIGAFSRKNIALQEEMEKVFKLFPRLRERRHQKGQTLSGGEAQMLAIGRSLMAEPKLLLLDEPSLGIAPILVKEIFEMIKKINELGTTIILVEQNAHLSLEICDYAYILENGKVALKGKAEDLREDETVRQLYLGS